MDEKNFFAKLAGVGPDGKFSNYSQKKAQTQNVVKSDFGKPKNGSQTLKAVGSAKEIEEDVEIRGNDGEDKFNEANEPEGQLAIDIYSTETNFIVEAPIAGVKAEDIDIAITIDSITIKGKRIKENGEEEKDYINQECFWGIFSRSVVLPQEIDADRSSASFKNGILKVILPKIQRNKPKKLKVNFVRD